MLNEMSLNLIVNRIVLDEQRIIHQSCIVRTQKKKQEKSGPLLKQ